MMPAGCRLQKYSYLVTKFITRHSVDNVYPVGVRCSRPNVLQRKSLSTSNNDTVHKHVDAPADPNVLFFSGEVQTLLHRLTGIDFNIIFKPKKLGVPRRVPEYKFLRTEEIEQELEKAKAVAVKKLQIPPVLDERKPINEVLSYDAALQGQYQCKHVAVDISQGKKDSERVMVVRDADGTLRKAEWEERDRMFQVYFPTHGKREVTPVMFQDQYLKKLLQRNEIMFILDRSCIQFEPNSSDYIRVTRQTYEYISDTNQFDLLKSTRHFGALVFYLAKHKKIDKLLLHLVKTSRLSDAASVISLFHLLHSSRPLRLEPTELSRDDALHEINDYIRNHSTNKGQLELALQGLDEIQEEETMTDDDGNTISDQTHLAGVLKQSF